MSLSLEAKYRRVATVLKNIVVVDRGGFPDTVQEAEEKLDRIRSAGEKARDVLREVGELPPKECPQCQNTKLVPVPTTGEPGCECGQLHCPECGEDPAVFAGTMPPASPRKMIPCPKCSTK